jgi:hypothetical protein
MLPTAMQIMNNTPMSNANTAPGWPAATPRAIEALQRPSPRAWNRSAINFMGWPSVGGQNRRKRQQSARGLRWILWILLELLNLLMLCELRTL